MKKLLAFLCAMVAMSAYATTVNLNWTVDGNSYTQTTCETGGNLTLPAQNPTKYGYTFQGWYMNNTIVYGTGRQTGTPTPTNPVEPVWYQNGNLVLRALGNIKDSYSTTTGKITRNIGVKVFDGNETLNMPQRYYIKSDAVDVLVYVSAVSMENSSFALCNQAQYQSVYSSIWAEIGYANKFTFNGGQLHLNIANDVLGITDYTQETIESATAKMRAFLRQQYANGTPVTVYYPLETPVEEFYEEQLN